jgi:Ca-activated chloride channel homolog
MSFELAHPWWLLALLPVAALWWRALGALGGPAAGVTPWRRKLAAGLRLFTLAVLVLLLAGLRKRLPSEQMTVTFLVDRSLSTRRQSAFSDDYVAQAIAARPQKVQIAVVHFGAEAVSELAPTRSPYVPKNTHRVNREDSDLAAAVQFAASSQPPGQGGRLVLLSDGRETRGNLLEAAEALTSSGLELDTVALPESTEPEALVEELRCPPRVDQKTPFDLVATVYSTHPVARAELQLLRDGKAAGRFPVQLQRGRNVFLLPQSSDKPGALRYELQLSLSHDAERANNKASGLTIVEGPSRVLVVHPFGQPDRVSSTLRARGLQADSVDPSGLPEELGEWLGYQSVVLDNVSSTDLSTDQLEAIPALVREAGLGLVMLGGPDSFAAGGYGRTPLAEALPVDLRVQRRRLTPPTAQLHVIDKSGSMAEVSRGVEHMAMAREASIAALEILTPEDMFGVIGFDDAYKWVVPLQAASKPKAIAGNVARLRAGGGTDLYPALKEAVRALAGSSLSSRHVLILSDGATAPADFEKLLAEARKNNIAVTTVAVGEGADLVFLTRLAKLGKGRSYVADSAQALPRIFARETMLSAQSAFDERPVRLKAGAAHAVLQGVDTVSAPALLGHDLVTPRGAPHQVLVETAGGDAVLAVGRYGLGKSVAFTGDSGRRWSSDWAKRADFSQMLLQAVRWSLADAQQGPLQLSTGVDKLGRLDIRAQLSPELAPQGLVASLLGADAKVQNLELVQVAPDRYEVQAEVGASGAAVLHVGTPDGQLAITQPVTLRRSQELGGSETQTGLLQEGARLGHGRFNPAPSEVFRALAHPPGFFQDLQKPLLILALLALLTEVAVRRLPLPGWKRAAAPTGDETSSPSAVEALRERVNRSPTRARSPKRTVGPLPEQSPATAPAPAEGGGSSLERLRKLKEERRKRS